LVVILDGGETLVSRLERALQRRDREMNRLSPQPDVPTSQTPRDSEAHITPVGLIDHFPIEPGGSEEKRPPPIAPVTQPRWRPAAPPPRGPASDSTSTSKSFSPKAAGKIVGVEMDPRSAEQYRRLAASLHQVQVERGIKKVMVASAVAGEGKTLTALNLAVTLSESYLRRVVLVDADLRCPRVHELLDSAPIHGLNEALKAAHPKPLILTMVSPRLSILPAGQADPDPMGQLTGARMASVLDELALRFDWVVVDTSPVVLLPDANLLAGMVDGALLVIRAGQTSYDLVDRAIQELGRKRILGLVLNQVEDKVSQYPASAYRSASAYRR
jgi:protein-tyrosine kinase